MIEMGANLRFAVFDCDGTLVDSLHHIVAGMRHAFAGEGLPVPDRELVSKFIGLPLVSAMVEMLPDGDPDLHLRLADGYREAAHGLDAAGRDPAPLYPGCREVLDRLRNEGVLLGIATGKGRRGLIQTLDDNGLSDHFIVTKTADDGPGKPNPDILLDAMAEVGAEPWETIVIGDTVFDIEMAVNARTLALGVSWGYHEQDRLLQAGAACVVDSFEEMPHHLNELWSKADASRV